MHLSPRADKVRERSLVTGTERSCNLQPREALHGGCSLHVTHGAATHLRQRRREICRRAAHNKQVINLMREPALTDMCFFRKKCALDFYYSISIHYFLQKKFLILFELKFGQILVRRFNLF